MTTPPRTLNGILVAHIGWWIGLVPVAIVAGRLLVASGGNLATAQLILQYSAVFPLVLGTLLPVLPVAALVVGWILLGRSEAVEAQERRGVALVPVVGSVLLLSGLLLTPWNLLLIAVGLIVAITVLLNMSRRRPRLESAIRYWTTGLSTAVGAAIVVGVLLPRPMWLPAEVIGTADGTEFVGYVLGSSGDSLVVVVADPREPLIVNDADVVSREVCSNASTRASLGSFLYQRWADGEVLPCPEVPSASTDGTEDGHSAPSPFPSSLITIPSSPEIGVSPSAFPDAGGGAGSDVSE